MENKIQKIREELFAAQLVIAEVLDNPHHPAMDNRHPQHDAAMEALEALEGRNRTTRKQKFARCEWLL
jgi:hypothetical protein